MKFITQPGGHLRGSIDIPGDKSISHRAVMLGSLADGTTRVSNLLTGTDVLATVDAFRELGVTIERPSEGDMIIHGVGLHGLQEPNKALDLGNSGTSIRLLSGILAGQAFDSQLSGDDSLCKRPMRRILDPLKTMGAVIEGQEDGTPPINVHGGQALQGINYKMPMASAQVKSCLLFAGMYAAGETAITEPGVTRDHSERMLEAFGYPVKHCGPQVRIKGGGSLTATDIKVPGDISSAAFFMVGACIAKNSELILNNVGLNPTRLGVINILRIMGANLEIIEERFNGHEPVADIRIRSSQLRGVDIPLEQVPLAIDEFPALFIAAACAEGVTVLRGAEELRVKESDRIRSMANGLRAIGITCKSRPDGIIIQGGQIEGGEVNSFGDHRVAMAFAMASLASEQPIQIENCANVATSFPDFVNISRGVGLRIDTKHEALHEQ